MSVTEKIKRDQMAAYGLQGTRLADEELDHLVPLELGGAPQDVANLWPEPWSGDTNVHEKDAVENFLHDQVCRGAMQLADAQRAIATDWLSVYTGSGNDSFILGPFVTRGSVQSSAAAPMAS